MNPAAIPFHLSGKNILITGASSGIGRAIAIVCASMGAHLYITGRNEEQLSQTLQQLKGSGHVLVRSDLTCDAEVDHLIDVLPPLHGVVSNAGINKRSPVHYIKTTDLDTILRTNLTGPVLLIKKLLRNNRILSDASLVFISSIAVFHSSIGDGIYSASKGGLTAFTKTLALELANRRIRVNTIQPGMVRTGFTERGPLSADDYARDEKSYPLGRYGTPDDIAYAALFLLSDQSCWMTGSDLVIDGGRTLV